MKLIIAIIRNEDAKKLTQALLAKEYHLTEIASRGGFLRKPNTTILVGIKDKQVKEVLGIIKKNCSAHKEFLNTAFLDGEADKLHLAQQKATPIQVGGASVFILDVDRFIKI